MSDWTLKAMFKMAGGQYGGSPLEKLIVDATVGIGLSGECHVEALLSPTESFSALPSAGVRIVNELPGPARRWWCLDTGLVIPDAARQWALAECGQRYDEWDAFRSGFEGAEDSEIRPMFCSMAVARLYNQCGGKCLDYQPGALGSGDPNPHRLAQLLTQYGAVTCSIPDNLFSQPVGV